MQPRKAIIIDIPLRKFMNEPPENRVIEQSGNRVIEKQRQEAMERGGGDPALGRSGDLVISGENLHRVAPNPGEIGAGQPETTALAVGGVCTRRRGNGTMCGRPADGGRDECWLHAEWYSLLPAVFGMPYPEDAVAIHQILSRTMSMVIGGELSPQKAQAITKLCRELRRNLMWYQREMGMW